MSATLVSTLAGLVITGLVQIVMTWLKSAKSDAALRKEGADDANAAANKEASDAQSRMADADAQPRSRSIVAGRLRDGSA